ncbi:MAG: gliding motility protein GldN [Williamsia sp.]|nr:gliding motility protein GldN [Williamsia sp.]
MNRYFVRLTMAALLLAVCFETVNAQRTPKRRNTTKQTTTSKNRGNAKPTDLGVAPAVKDTTPPPAPNFDDKFGGNNRKSLRNDNAIELNPVKDRVPLAYEDIREDDAVYRQRVWLELDIHEKMNLPFLYQANEDNGNQRFFSILMNCIKNDSITPFSPDDDRFTTPITYGDITKSLVGTSFTIQVPDLVADPNLTKGITKDSTVYNEFDPDIIQKYWIKEDIIFDKESSRLHFRILGIAPLKTIRLPDSTYTVTPLFWIYYPDIRPSLAKYQAYNGKNYGARMSWEEIFEDRMFASRVVKSTMDNPYDRFIEGYIKDPILRLLEGENIKDKIFNYEQDLWQY